MTTASPRRTPAEVAARITEFKTALLEFIHSHDEGDYHSVEAIRASVGKRYCRIVVVRTGDNHGYAYAFIDIATGDLYKAASWKAPAKNVRGNIFAEDFDIGERKACTRYSCG